MFSKIAGFCRLTFALLLSQTLWPQQSGITGSIRAHNSKQTTEPIIGAAVYWLVSSEGTISDLEGHFFLPLKIGEKKIVISYPGYKTDTIEVAGRNSIDVLLSLDNTLEEVVLTAKTESTVINSLHTLKVEKITRRELLKAACCNLSESFETNPTVDVSFSDAITGAKTLKLLGLDGVYTQILKENLPLIRGLGIRYALESIPGPWLQSILLSKGAGSVANGYESISGQINLDIKRPYNMENWYADIFGDTDGRIEANLIKRIIINEKLAGSILTHGTWKKWRRDMNKDGWTDNPAKSQWNLMNRWEYQSKKFGGQWGAWYYDEDRLSGQISYDKGTDQGPGMPYGIQNHIRRAELFSKTGWVHNKHQSTGLQLSASHYQQKSSFGQRNYEGIQNGFYANLISQLNKGEELLGTFEHVFKGGLSFVWDDYIEKFMIADKSGQRHVPGIFSEYCFNPNARISLIAGMRADYHNIYHFQASPRLHFKYAFNEKAVLRASAARGFREARVLAENPLLWITAKVIALDDQLFGLESAWNFGTNFTYKTEWYKKPITFSTDFYRTQFTHQVILDTYHSPDTLFVYDLDGESFSNFAQAQVEIEVINNLDLRLAGKLEQVKQQFKDEGLLYKPLTPFYTFLANAGWESADNHWLLNFTTQIKGPQVQNLPLSDENIWEKSPVYAIFNAQITYKWKEFEFYTGGENIGNYLMPDPIISGENPYLPSFNAGNTWGPIGGRMIYTGIRWRRL